MISGTRGTFQARASSAATTMTGVGTVMRTRTAGRR
jgi:hypothetical protein